MVGKVERVAREMIKPSSPTPHHLRHLKISFLDQLVPPVYVPLIFFYENGRSHGENSISQKSQLLKTSLSNALNHFYPLAGRMIDDDVSIDCNDAGVLLVEASVDAGLMQAVKNPKMDEINRLLPLDSGSMGSEIEEKVLVAVQINRFNCGGIAVGVQMCHKIADANSLVEFMLSWASVCRGAEQITQPDFNTASLLFPPRDLSRVRFKLRTGMNMKNIVTKRFVFDNKQLDDLKEAAKSAHVKNPSRVEAVSAFLWSQILEVAKAKSGRKTVVAARYPVNIRPRMSPPLPSCTFGNILMGVRALPSIDGENGIHYLAGKLRDSMSTINENYVNKVRDGDEYMQRGDSSAKGDIEVCGFSSWCRFPVYEVDYGWGKPVWACTATICFKNSAFLMSTKSGDGIEVFMNIPEEDASFFDSDLKFVPLGN